MAVGLVQTVPPAQEPVDFDEIKTWIRQDLEDQNLVITQLIKAARQYVESRLGLQLITAQWQASYDRFPRYASLGGLQYASEILWSQRIPQTELSGRYWPDRASFRLPRPPLQSVISIQFVDGATGNVLVQDPSTYLVDTATRPGRIAPVPGSIWPIIKQQLNAVTISFQAGFGPGPASVPEPIRLAIKLLVAHWFETRHAVVDYNMAQVPLAVDALLASEWTGEWF
jgi:uncharacterized phiE125 gp8 family phage protein